MLTSTLYSSVITLLVFNDAKYPLSTVLCLLISPWLCGYQGYQSFCGCYVYLCYMVAVAADVTIVTFFAKVTNSLW
jgi:hypothetical protein